MRWITFQILTFAILSTPAPAQPTHVPVGDVQADRSGPRENPHGVRPRPAHDTGGQMVASGLEAPSPAPTGARVTEQSVTDEIAALQNAIESATDLTEEVKAESMSRLDAARKSLQISRQQISVREKSEKEIESAPSRTEAIRTQLSGAIDLPNPEVPKRATVAFLESRLDEMRQHVELAEEEAAVVEEATESRATRLNQISKDLQGVEQHIIEAQEALEGSSGEGLPARANRLVQRAHMLALQEQIPALKTQRSLLEATSELMPLQRDLAVRKASAAKKQLQRWEEAVSNWRKDESKRQAEQARLIAEKSHPALRSYALRNAEIAELRITSAEGIARIAKSLNEIDKSSTQLDEQFKDLRGKVEHAGATTSTGILLRKQRGELPSVRSFAKHADMVAKEMPTAHLRLMELKQLRRDVADVDEAVGRVIATQDPALAKYDPARVTGFVKRLLSDRRNLLDKAIPDQDTYLQDLNELDLANKAFEHQVAEMREFLDQRVLWMRSTEVLSGTNLRQAAVGLAELLAPSRWAEVVRVCVGDLVSRPVVGILVTTMLVLAIMFRANLRSKQALLCDPPTRGETISVARCMAAFALTFVVSVRWPLLLAAIGFQSKLGADATPWTIAVGDALITTILFVWGLELISELSSRAGIGEKLLGWSSDVTASLRGTVDTTLWFGTPLFVILQLTYWQETPEMENLQRVMFITILLLVGTQLGWLVRPHGKLMKTLRANASDAMVYRLRKPIWILSSAAPLAFAAMSVAGYHFSAYQLSGRLAENAAAIVTVIILYSLALCWVKMKAHNREVEQSRARDGIEDSATIMPSEATVVQDEFNTESEKAILAAASQETQDLLRYAAMIGLVCGSWFIWSDVLPALRVFDRVELWQSLETVSEVVVGTDGSESIQTFEQTVPTTLTNLFVAILICMVSVVVSRRLPALLELTLLDRLPLDQGGRQAIAILVRYAATLAGVLFACHAINLSWSSVQWMAAAMTVGLGFGLQEIFANLVSGLIILFERPIRAGDLVTVDEVTGNVTRMQIRATTITDFDRREFIVPNKRFITDNVINWTLSDPISRVIFPVGVAYGTDVDQVHEILNRIAKYERIVLDEPASVTVLTGFGDSTLDFELRVFIPQREMIIDVMNRINGAIAKEFEKAEIEIAFPQLDLHVKGNESIAALEPSVIEAASVRAEAEHPSPTGKYNRLQPRRSVDAWSA